MNTGPGRYSRCFRLSGPGLGLWLAGLLLPLYAAAQPQAPVGPGYNPWSIHAPYNTQQNPVVPAPPPNLNRPQTSPQPFGAPPRWSYPQMQTAPRYPQQQPARRTASRPYLEITLDDSQAYVHQNLVMTLRVVSAVNLKTVSALLPENDDVIFRQLGEITAESRNRQGQREIVNTLYYQLTPLRSGDIELGPVRVTGTMEGGSPTGTAYEAAASPSVRLTVLDPVPGVNPWLPLHDLELSASLSDDERIGAGEPLTLTVEQRAEGMSGTQLPSLEAQLQAPGQRLYREKTEYQGTVSTEGRLVGVRKDRFTLVPQQGNQVEIPSVRLDWWNIDRGRKETAVLPARLLNESGRGQGQQGPAGNRVLGGVVGSVPLWLALLAIAFLLGRYWSRLTPVLKRFGSRFWKELDSSTRPLRRHLATVAGRLSPQRNLPLIRRRIADSLPRSARLWFCVRSADEEQDPDDWSQVLRFLMNRRLGIPAQLPMSKLAQHIIEIHPGADANKIRSLLAELEAAVFAGRTISDFNAWKQAFKHQIRPRPFAWLGRKRRYLRASGLPSLNPGTS